MMVMLYANDAKFIDTIVNLDKKSSKTVKFLSLFLARVKFKVKQFFL